MRLLLYILTLLFVGLVTAAPVAFAYDINSEFCATAGGDTVACADDATGGPDPISGSDGILGKVVTLFSIITGIVAVIVIILMGLRYVTSNGDAGKAASARQGIMYALAGLIVALLAQAIVMFVIPRI